jgi:hypothetical protein
MRNTLFTFEGETILGIFLVIFNVFGIFLAVYYEVYGIWWIDPKADEKIGNEEESKKQEADIQDDLNVVDDKSQDQDSEFTKEAKNVTKKDIISDSMDPIVSFDQKLYQASAKRHDQQVCVSDEDSDGTLDSFGDIETHDIDDIGEIRSIGVSSLVSEMNSPRQLVQTTQAISDELDQKSKRLQTLLDDEKNEVQKHDEQILLLEKELEAANSRVNESKDKSSGLLKDLNDMKQTYQHQIASFEMNEVQKRDEHISFLEKQLEARGAEKDNDLIKATTEISNLRQLQEVKENEIVKFTKRISELEHILESKSTAGKSDNVSEKSEQLMSQLKGHSDRLQRVSSHREISQDLSGTLDLRNFLDNLLDGSGSSSDSENSIA